MRRIRGNVTVSLAIGAALAGVAARGSSQAAPSAGLQPAAVTYVGSSGFLIQAGGKKVLIDAVYDGYPGAYAVPAGVQEPLLAGRAPFDGIDLVLATHVHSDHFGAAAVRRVLESNPQAVFVGPAAAVAALTGVEGRTRALEVPVGERRAVEVNGVRVEAMRLSHGDPPPGAPDLVNLGYLVTVGGRKFFHTGDVSVGNIPISLLQSLGIPEERVDVAFVPHFLLSTPVPLPWVTEGLRPRFVVASHLQYSGEPPDLGQIRRNFPNAVVLLGEGERWVVP